MVQASYTFLRWAQSSHSAAEYSEAEKKVLSLRKRNARGVSLKVRTFRRIRVVAGLLVGIGIEVPSPL